MNPIELMETSDLTFSTVPAVLKRIFSWISSQKNNNLVIDLTNITSIDSAGVALLVELRRLTYTMYKKNLAFKVSSQMKQLIGFYELDGFLEHIE